MPAARVLRVHGPRDLRWDVEALSPLERGQVRVRTKWSAVSVASELSVVEGRTPVRFPSRLGYQTLGHVEQAEEESGLLPGTRVVTTLGHASAGIVSAARCLPVPDPVPDRVALAVILGEETFKGIRKVTPHATERVLIAGAGLLGLLTVFNLTRRGARDVTVIEPDAARRALAEAFGAHAFAPGCLPHDQYDVGFECSAHPKGFHELLSSLRPHGRACVLSDGNWGALVLPSAFHDRELRLVASSDGDDYPAYARWLWATPDPLLATLFSRTITPDALIGVFGRLRSFPRPVSVVVDWTAEP